MRRLRVPVLFFVLLSACTLLAGAAGMPASPASPAAADRVAADSARATQMVAAGHADSAMAILTNLVTRVRAIRDPRALLRALRMRGAALANTGAGAAALVPLDEAARIAQSSQDTLTLLRVLRWQAYAYGEQGRFAEQQAAAEHLLRLARTVHDRVHEAHALHSLGWVALNASRFPEARQLLARSVATFEQLHDPGNESYVRATFGSALLSLGLYDEAKVNYARVITLARQQHLPWVEARALNDLGAIEAEIGDLAAAAQHYDEAYTMHVRIGQWQDAVLELQNRVGVETSLGRIDDAIVLARDGIAICEARGLRVSRGWLLASMADAERERGHVREEGRLLQAVLALGDTLPVDLRVSTQLHEAERLADRDSMPAALAISRGVVARHAPQLSVESAEHARSTAARLELHAGHPQAALHQALAILATPGNDASWARVANAHWLEARAEAALGRKAEARANYDRAIAAWEFARLRHSDSEFREAIGSELGPALATGGALATLDAPGAAPGAAIAEAYALAQRLRARTLLERMRGPRSALPDSGTVMPIALGTLQRTILHPGELLLEMYTSPDTTLVFAITRDRASWYTLPGATALAPAIRLASELLATPTATPDEAQARRAAIALLTGRLLAPAAAAIRAAGSVIVAPDGVLHPAPFEAMIATLVPGHAGPAVTRVPSATVFAQLRMRRPSAAAYGLFAFAGPPSQGQVLAGAAREVRALHDHYEDVTVRDAVIDTARWSAASLAPYRILHLAAHTQFDTQRPWRSGLLVGTEVLSAAQIAQQRLMANLVVLTSCRSAGGRARAGEGVAGLTNAFLAAGAPAVVAALWPVDDQATEQFSATFYDALARGATTAGALEAARARLAADPATSAPFHWAGWVLIGDGDARVPLRVKAFSTGHLATNLVGLLALLTVVAAGVGLRAAKKTSPRV